MTYTLTLIKPDFLITSVLPTEVTGKHWVCDVDSYGKKRRIASVEAEITIKNKERSAKWILKTFSKARFCSKDLTGKNTVELSDSPGLYAIQWGNEDPINLLVRQPRTNDKCYKKWQIKTAIDITIGRSSACVISTTNPFVSSHHATIKFSGHDFSISDNNSINGTYVNGQSIAKNTSVLLKTGDTVFILGIQIIIGTDFIAHNNPDNNLTITPPDAMVSIAPTQQGANSPTNSKIDFYEDDNNRLDKDTFFRSPRIKRDIDTKSWNIEAPPAQAKQEEPPAILKLGPSLGMALASALMGSMMVLNMTQTSGESGVNLLRIIPMAAMVLVMILGAILWPNLQSRYNKKQNAKKEKKRQQVYSDYLSKCTHELAGGCAEQKNILVANRIDTNECLNRAKTKDRRLYERTALHSDFLELRIGVGNTAFVADVKWPDEKLTMEDDPLRDQVLELAKQPLMLNNVPLALSLVENFVCGIISENSNTPSEVASKRSQAWCFLRGLIAQVVTLHAPDEVKLVLFAADDEKSQWDPLGSLPHIFDNEKNMRYLATSTKDSREISLLIERELKVRQEAQTPEVISDYGTYYVVVVTSKTLAENTGAIERMASLRKNLGFSLIVLGDHLRELPKECKRIVELGVSRSDSGSLISKIYNPRDPAGVTQLFESDIELDIRQTKNLVLDLGSINYGGSGGLTTAQALPKSLGFLEMFEVGKPEHLNIATRWADSNPCDSLETPLGIADNGELSMLDIHEDFHGPHGLIAGTTGSGKSEFIITYVLSLAVNYRPDEVSFVLIDYKGGGLAGAFESDKNRLPHLAGTITNLDGSAITRSMIAIDSELRRRQSAFNVARDVSGLGNMDIYKYQELYRLGQVSEPIPHMLIISDEFAELKAQEPEFMEELIKTARIGRSLGVHLILATQKPSGVVNDQIWSNAKFKVCLKVADAQDSREIIKRDEAAELVDAGRFYLQVGYNELFALGQSAYAGTKYKPKEYFIKPRDNAVVLISNTGRPLLSIRPKPESSESDALQQAITQAVPEQVAVLQHIAAVAKDEELQAPALWLEPIPSNIYLGDLIEKYSVHPKETIELDPVFGELDDPYNQSQIALSLPISAEGNVIIYGSTGSGKASLVSTILHSLYQEHSAKTVHTYIIDLGAETFAAFAQAPQTGDVLFTPDVEKIDKLFKMLKDLLQDRRRILAAAGLNFSSYAGDCLLNKNGAENGAEPMPSVLIVINEFDIFTEMFEAYLDDLTMLTRDGVRYGIYFLLTASRANSINYRLLPNFSQKLVLKFNSDDDHLSVFGVMRNVVKPDCYMRGLVKLDKVYEFQAAQISENQNEFEAIREFCESLKLNDKADGLVAKAVPCLPNVVTLNTVRSLFNLGTISLSNIPIGIYKEDISLAAYDFERHKVFFALSEDEAQQMDLMDGLLSTLALAENINVTVFDPDGLLPMQAIADLTSGDSDNLQIFNTAESITTNLKTLLSAKQSEQFVVILSMRSFVDSIDKDLLSEFEQFVSDGTYKQLAGFVICGEPARFTTFSFEQWFRELAAAGNGVWLGSGFDSQQTIRNGGYSAEFRASLDKSLAWLAIKGQAKVIKYIVIENRFD